MSEFTAGTWVWSPDRTRLYAEKPFILEPILETKQEVSEANARLIAAASEMYELLEELIEPGKIGTADYSIYRAIEEAERLVNRINNE